jgi:protein-disulfide isomerase
MNDQSRDPKQPHPPDGPVSPTRHRLRWLGGLLVLALIVGAIWVLWPKSSAPQSAPANLNNEPALGPADAPVTLIEYGDFGCTTCRGWYNAGVLEKLRAKYGDQLRFVWRDFPIITAQSPKAAEAAQCAFDQGKFWQYHDLLYQRAPALSVSDLKSYAAELGLDTARFNQCLDSGEKAAIIEKSKQDAQQRGFTATPDFLLNGQTIIGPPSFADLETRIDAILK